MKALKKNDLGVSPVIAVILMVAITVVLAGVVFLWAQSFTDEAGGDVDTINVKVKGFDDVTDYIEIEIVSGTYTWAEYAVTVDGIAMTFVPVGTETSNSAGEKATFTAAADLGASQDEVTVKIVDIEQNKVVFEDDIILV